MPQTIPAFLERVRQAAVVLEQPDTLDLITAVQEQTRQSRLRMLVVGEPGTGRFSLVNALLGQPALLPASPIPRAPTSVSIGYGDTTTLEAVARDDTRLAMPLERLRTFLTNPDEHETSHYHHLEIKTNSDLLKTSDIRIETIDAIRSVAEWKAVLACTDYVLLVLKAVALLSEQEKRFIREALQPHFALQRVALVINQMDLVAEEDRASIPELVRAFLGSFESQPLMLEVSATQALHGLETGDMSPQSGYAALMRLVREDLVERHRVLKATAMRQAAEICLTELMQEARRQYGVMTTSAEQLNKLSGQLDSQNQWVQERIQRAQHHVETFIDTLIKEQFMREIEGFNTAFRQQFADEIMGIDDVRKVKRHLTGYIEAVWTEFFQYQLGFLRNRIASEMKMIGDMMVEDLRTLIGEDAPAFRKLLDEFDPAPSNLKAFVMPSRGNHEAGTLATWMQLGGLIFLVANLQLGVGLIGVGQAIRLFFERDIQAADKQAIAQAVVDASYELEPQIKYQVQSYFDNLTSELQQTVAHHYEHHVTGMRQSLEQDMQRHHDIQARKDAVEHLLHVTIPELKQSLENIPT